MAYVAAFICKNTIVFVEKEAEQGQAAEANAKDAAEIFKLAERLSEAELEKMQRTVNKFELEDRQMEA